MNKRFLQYYLAIFFVISLSILSALMPKSGKAEDAQIIAPSDKDTCLACHAEKVNATKFTASAHGHLSCQLCHSGIDRFPHPEKAIAKKPQCGACHTIKVSNLAKSVHQHADKKTKSALSCQVCHGSNAHEVVEASKLEQEQQVAPCLKCHANLAQAMAASVHGISSNASNGHRPNCLFCHGGDPHNLKPIAATAIPRDYTCRTCHTDVARNLAQSAHGNSGMASGNRLSCLTCHGENPHAVNVSHRMTREQKNARCQTCHADVMQSMTNSAQGISGHGGKNAPTCVACHGDSMHGIKRAGQLTLPQTGESCVTCHVDVAKTLAASVHGKPGADGKAAPTCLTCHWAGSAHKIKLPDKANRLQVEAACKNCHSNLATSLKDSIHDRPDRLPGDHPSCLSCHGGMAHSVKKHAALTPKEQVAICSNCHNNAERMARYGMDTGAVSSYNQSFHGRAVMRFNQMDTATCTDCHGLHGVLAPAHPDSATNTNHLAATCSRCHPGGNINFAASGANHLRLRIESSPLLIVEEVFFQLLIFGTMIALFGMVVLDLRRKAFSLGAKPEAGKFVSVLIAVSILCLAAGIIMAFLHIRYVEWVWIIGLALVFIAFIAYIIYRKMHPHHQREKVYPRFNLVFRIQHILLASTFIILVLTGLPLHFADVEWLRKSLDFFGGFQSARIVHRVAGLLMVFNWFWHGAYLLLLWKRAGFSWKSWTMLPTMKDVRDVIDYFKYLLSLRQEPPEWDRFQFREKFDYYADIWGTIVMGSTGFVLWFPTAVGNHLPDLAFGVSYIAHSYEGLLAMMAIIIWHFYNTHFNPDTFPMNATWLTGTMTASEMEREHPLEKERLDNLLQQ